MPYAIYMMENSAMKLKQEGRHDSQNRSSRKPACEAKELPALLLLLLLLLLRVWLLPSAAVASPSCRAR